DDIAAGADSFLKSAVVVDQRISRAQHGLWVDRVLRVVDVMMTIAGIGRCLELGRFGTLGPFDLLCGRGGATSNKESGGGSNGDGLQQFASIPRRLGHGSLPSVPF